MTGIEKSVERYNILFALDQAVELNDACPVAGVNSEFSPEKIAQMAKENPEELLKSRSIWQCLTCGLCCVITGDRVDMSRFILEMRQEAVKRGFYASQTHGGMLLTAQRMSVNRELKPNRTAWIDERLQVESEKGDYLYWVGGAPFFAALMPELKPTAIDSARAAIRLLNALHIKPLILKDERFSGHDLLWTGDREGFLRLAEQNIHAIKSSGAHLVVVSSPEDYYTLAKSYPEYLGTLDFEVRHITEVVAEHLSKLRFGDWNHRVTYHDPCRLGRGMGVYDAPRKILEAIPGVELLEMKNTREYSSCCGTSCWINCNRFSKLMQINRLREAVSAGAQALVTTCWECTLHFRCATRAEAWRQVFLEVKDLLVLAASLLRG